MTTHNQEITFPYLMRGGDTGLIVLFKSMHKGVVVCPGVSGQRFIGEHSNEWGAATNPYWSQVQFPTNA